MGGQVTTPTGHPITIRTRIASGRIQRRTSGQPTHILASGIRDIGPIPVHLVTVIAGAGEGISADNATMACFSDRGIPSTPPSSLLGMVLRPRSRHSLEDGP